MGPRIRSGQLPRAPKRVRRLRGYGRRPRPGEMLLSSVRACPFKPSRMNSCSKKRRLLSSPRGLARWLVPAQSLRILRIAISCEVMRMRLRICLVLLLTAPFLSRAQSILGVGVRAGYTFSGSFTGRSGNSGSLQGPEVGLDVPIGLPLPISGLGGLQFNFSPSLFAATGGWSGTDFQGNVYRLLASARLSIPGSPLYVRLGAGYAYASASPEIGRAAGR